MNLKFQLLPRRRLFFSESSELKKTGAEPVEAPGL